MKKGLICACALLGAAATASALPAAPKIYENLLINRVSPDVRYASSDMFGILTIFDLDTDQVYVYAPEDPNGQEIYTSGLGNSWSATGILVGTNSYDGTATYWQDGEWHQLPNPSGRGVWVQGINKAGTVICATVDVLPSDNLTVGLLNVPMVWTKGEDGKWNNPVMLPYPTKDFTNRVPQMATALVVSDDGKKIAGQVRDYFGAFPMPILYEQDASGKWSYRLLAENLFNPKGRVFPDFQEDAPVSPEMQDFISDPAAKAAWEAAYENWVESGYSTKYPDPVDYMSQEDGSRYNEAVAEYNAAAEKYNAMLEEFTQVFSKMFDESAMFVFNEVYMTGAGDWYASYSRRSVVEDPSDPFSSTRDYSTPMTMNIAGGGIVEHPMAGADAICLSAIADDGTLIGYTEDGLRHSYIKRYGGEWEDLYEFLVKNVDDTQKEWLKDNICHTFDISDPLSGMTTSFVDEPMLGNVNCTPDLKVFTAATDNYWDMINDPNYYYSYMIPTPKVTVGCQSVNLDDAFTLKASKGGVVETDAVADIYVYDMQGRLVFRSLSTTGIITTGLDEGLYTVKAIGAKGTKVLKALF